MEREIIIAGKPDQIENYVIAFQEIGIRAKSIFQCTWEKALTYPGLVLPGGGDIAPHLFGQPNLGCVNIDEDLDRLQMKLAEEYIRQKKPVLGICKGMQVINVCFGGTILQQLPTAYAHAYRNGDQYHMTIARQDSFLYPLYGYRFSVNSAHHQGIDRLGHGLEAIQFAQDNVIEGIIHKELPIIGVQWHPERMKETDKRAEPGNRLLEFWIRLFPKNRSVCYTDTSENRKKTER